MPDTRDTHSEADTGAPNMKSLKGKRAQIKAQCTRFGSYLAELDVQNTSIVELRQRLQKFNETWNNFDKIQAEIEEIEVSPDDARNHDEERRSFEERYFAITSELEMIIESKMGIAMPNLNQIPRNIREATPATQGSIFTNDHLKLPRVNLPTFSGMFEEWIPFRNMFQSMINQNAMLPNIQKMQYLIAALKGEARDVIGSLEVSDENYMEAWDMLKERYDDSGFIVQKHIKALFEIPAIIKENHILLRRLLDSVLKHLRALKALKRPTEHWDDLIIYLVTSRLDPKTSRAWEISVKKGEIPTLKQLTDFLAQHCKALEASARTVRMGASGSNLEKGGHSRSTSANIATTSNKCAYCKKEDHAIYKCSDYLLLEVNKRIKEARSRKLCLNCLKGTSHLAKQCSLGPCRKCNKRHNTLLHLEQPTTKISESATVDTSTVDQEKVVATSVNYAIFKPNKQVLLATALVEITDSKGDKVVCRALLDSGSQSCFITSSCAKRLSLKQVSTHIPVCGLGEMSTQTNKRVKIILHSRINKFSVNLDCLIIDRITQAIPVHRINVNELQIPECIILADPEFYKSSEIDLLLGAEIFFDLMCIGKIKNSKTQPTWQKTILGWIASGNLIAEDQKHKKTICGLVVNEQLNLSLTRFWQMEHNERQNTRTPEERICEGHFAKTYKRNEEGRFVVSLPTKEEQLRKLGDSRDLAIQQLKNLERRFARQPQLKEDYTKFMREYLNLKHMREVPENSARWNIQPQYYMPHHCVIKESSATTKLRVVFNASSKTTSGISLNDALMAGPVLQQDLFSILLRFRRFMFVMTADIAKMYRQVLVEEDQVALQRIVWREEITEAIKIYEMLTVTYGTVPASFLVTKSIQQLAELEAEQFPIGSLIALRDFYIDNLLSGADSIKEALIIREQVTALLRSGGFVLRQWASNIEELVRDIPENVTDNAILELDKDGTVKTLGVKWNHAKDVFQYSIEIAIPVSCTKRSMLSSIAQIFDPLGLLAPVILTAKILIQELWKLRIDWDESLPSDIFTKWVSYVTDLQYLNGFCVPRQVVENHTDAEIQLHGFCDASERAYGACVYIRYLDHDKLPQVHLLCAKSRVAPLKIVSIPRLELCAAQLLAQLIDKIKVSLDIKIKKIGYWTDAHIVLCWIRATNKKLPVFVAHRVGEIQELTSVEDWNHVGTKENPADLVSRGTSPNELCSSQLWWKGPTWLKTQIQIDEQVELEYIEDSPADHQHEQAMLTISKPPEDDLLNKFSTFQKLVRVTATCIRFADRCKKRDEIKFSPFLTLEDLERARRCLIKREQLSMFEAEICALRENKIIPKNSSLRHLTPFLDNLGLLRVGGRLKHADLQYETKHPLVLPHHSRLTELIILHEHARHFHAGADATLAAVRQLYWPIRARGTVKKLIRNCIRCFRSRPRRSEQMMGDLPINRVTPSKPFSNTGVDFCGPIYVREGRRRGAKRVKAYIAIFICMAVKAVHLEVVSDMTTDAFLNAFKRFISRRGRPSNVYSDNGTNFVGANRELEKCKELFSHGQQGRNIMEHSASEGIKWHFIPSRAPHFGGLWESAVKSFKNHFYKTTVNAAMTFEEASTLVTQIEAILNSRPLTALSTDPNDLSYLSPGHFLIGSTVTSYPEANITDTKLNRLSKWQMIEQIRQHFWKRWSSEYLLNLQRRNKWLANVGPPIKVGQLVLCREDGLPPLKWSLGRVQTVFPGKDKIVRAAVIKTSTGEYKRPAIKLCVLPIENCVNDVFP